MIWPVVSSTLGACTILSLSKVMSRKALLPEPEGGVPAGAGASGSDRGYSRERGDRGDRGDRGGRDRGRR